MEIPDGYAQINWHFTGAAVPTGAQCTLGLNVTGVGVTAQEVADEVGPLWSTWILATQSSALTLVSASVKFGPVATGPSAEVAIGDAGTNSATAEVPNVALLVQKVTAAGGRAGRGRFYVPGMAGDVFASNGVSGGGTQAVQQTAFDNFHAALITSGFSPVLLHSVGAPITVPTPITSFQVSGLAATQRRRLRR